MSAAVVEDKTLATWSGINDESGTFLSITVSVLKAGIRA